MNKVIKVSFLLPRVEEKRLLLSKVYAMRSKLSGDVEVKETMCGDCSFANHLVFLHLETEKWSSMFSDYNCCILPALQVNPHYHP